MDGRDDLATLMAGVATFLQDAPSEQLTLEAIVAKAGDVVPGTSSASITIHSARRGYVTLAAGSDVAREADALQYAAGEGPCLETTDDDPDFNRSGDVRSDPRWPVWGPQAAALGVGSLLSVPLLAHSDRIGALNLYSPEVGSFAGRETVDLALLYAVHAAHALSSARTVRNLEVALSSRHTIGVAQGLIMERYGLDLERSFELLRRISSQTETKLAAVARQVVSTGTLPTVPTVPATPTPPTVGDR